MQESVTDINIRLGRLKGIGVWRQLYSRFLQQLRPQSIAEFGAGDPAFLLSAEGVTRRVALDVNPRLGDLYKDSGVEFFVYDFDRDAFPIQKEMFDVAVCSDVFEHLLYPEHTLSNISGCLRSRGVLFSHVPNEFSLYRTARVMFSRSGSVYFHPDAFEWNSPHLRRFTDKGYRTFLGLRFRYNLKISDLRYRLPARLVSQLGLPVPFCLEGGPTYASTNDGAKFSELREIKRMLRKTR